MEQHKKSALLVMDMQPTILSNLPESADLLKRVAQVIEKARARKIAVIFGAVGFREGAPEISPNNKSFSASRTKMAAKSLEEMTQIHPDLAPASNEIKFIKKRFSSFTGSDLEVVLRAQGITHLILTGVSTSGVVLSTTREAADKDYQLTILSDCCADPDEEVHRVLTTKVFPRQANVIEAADWLKD